MPASGSVAIDLVLEVLRRCPDPLEAERTLVLAAAIFLRFQGGDVDRFCIAVREIEQHPSMTGLEMIADLGLRETERVLDELADKARPPGPRTT